MPARAARAFVIRTSRSTGNRYMLPDGVAGMVIDGFTPIEALGAVTSVAVIVVQLQRSTHAPMSYGVPAAKVPLGQFKDWRHSGPPVPRLDGPIRGRTPGSFQSDLAIRTDREILKPYRPITAPGCQQASCARSSMR
jgi:hypothetical protein